jgi:O-antigen ligase
VLLKPSKFYIGILPISFAILFLASSRTSILALSVGLLVRVYFDVTRGDKVAQPANMTAHPSGNYFLNVSIFRKLLAGCVIATVTISIALRIVGTNASGTGRLENYQNTFSGSRESLFLGRGPSLFSINSTENTILTILSYYGIVGVILLVAILIGLVAKVRKLTRHEKSSFMIVFSVFLVASTGESLITGVFIDNGIFYIAILLLLTRLESPLMELPQT